MKNKNKILPDIRLLFIAVLFLLTSCNKMPDLTISSKDYSIADYQYKITLTVKNIGKAKSGKALVYINYINPDPPQGTNEIRIQKTEELPALGINEEYTFTKSIRLSDIHAKEIETIEVLTDAKNMVKESNENNNKETWTWDEGL